MCYYVLDTSTWPMSHVELEGEWRPRTVSFYGERRINRDRVPVASCEFVLRQPSGRVEELEQLAAGYTGTVCLFSDELIAVLERAGVDNLDLFPAVLRRGRKEKTTEYTNYKAVAIMGAIACLDKRSGKVDLGDGSGLLEGGVDKMYIDERKTDGLLMFRPRPGVGAVLVHERVKRAIEAAKLPGLRFYDPAEWGGF